MNCMLKAFSGATGIAPTQLIDLLGHDGNEIIFPEQPEPYNRRSFSVGEFAAILYFLGIKVIHIYDLPSEKLLEIANSSCVYPIIHNETHCEIYKKPEPPFTKSITGVILFD